jgi:hypothetical protein
LSDLPIALKITINPLTEEPTLKDKESTFHANVFILKDGGSAGEKYFIYTDVFLCAFKDMLDWPLGMLDTTSNIFK